MTIDENRATRRDLAQIAWAVLLLDLVAIGLGLLAAPYIGTGALWIGVTLAVWVTVAFALIVGLNLAVVWIASLWRRRRAERAAAPRRTR